jgi:hypothetical protein
MSILSIGLKVAGKALQSPVAKKMGEQALKRGGQFAEHSAKSAFKRGQFLGKAAGAVEGFAVEGAKVAGHGLKYAVKGTLSNAGKLANATKETATQGIRLAQSYAGAGINTAKGVSEVAISNAGQTAKYVVKGTLNNAGKLANATKDTATQGVRLAQSYAGAGINTVKGGLQTVYDKLPGNDVVKTVGLSLAGDKVIGAVADRFFNQK